MEYQRSKKRHLAETLVGLARKLLGVPSAGDSLESVTLGNTDGVDHLIGGEHLVDVHLKTEQLNFDTTQFAR